MTLPLPDGLDIVHRPLLHGRPGTFVLASGLELARQGSGRGPAPAHEAMTARLGIVDLDNLLLRGRLAVRHVALLARVGALALSSDGRCA